MNKYFFQEEASPSGGGVRFVVNEQGDDEDDDDEGPHLDAGEKQRLHRRDTPHHLKNKRINQQV